MKLSAQSAGDTLLTVVVLESRWAHTYECLIDRADAITINRFEAWDTSKYLTDTNGTRLIEEIVRRVRTCWTKNANQPSGVVLTMPGTLEGAETITSSSRLGIREPIPVAKIVSEQVGVPCRVFHDVECLAVGEDLSTSPSEHSPTSKDSAFVYVFADEGVGSKAILNGKVYVGAGAAGLLGRMTVQPDGSYYKALAARGTLEVFSGRPWVSENLVAMYVSELHKRPASATADHNLGNTLFRRALHVAADQEDWRNLDYPHIADGLKNGDPIAVKVLDVSARYLGFAINSVITILHPHRIALGGAMMSELPGFADNVIEYARQYSWALAWNRTIITVASLGRDAQVYGAVKLWSKRPK